VDLLRQQGRYEGDVDWDPFVALARAWQAEGDSLARANRPDDATAYYVGQIGLGSVVSRGCVSHVLRGDTFVGMGTSGLAAIRHLHSPACGRELVLRLRHYDQRNESGATISAREWAWQREAHAWSGRFADAILTRRPQPLTYIQRVLDVSLNRRDSTLRLLIADLAIRAYRAESGKLPATLSELVPAYFPAEPVDPFSGRPLVYHPAQDDFLLYSVGQDGHDDGGRFGTREQASNQSGFDSGLEFAVE
jgi:hypothetical protein